MLLPRLLRMSSRYPLKNVRTLSNIKQECIIDKNGNVKVDKFTPVYNFPYIRMLSALNRLKIYQTALTATTIPGTIILNQIYNISQDFIYLTTIFGVSGCLIFYSIGYFTEKFVGFVYLNEKEDTVKVSFIDFWGNRKDEIIPLKDVIPLTELPISPTDGLYFKLSRFSTENKLKINLKLGVVLDKSKFNKVFK